MRDLISELMRHPTEGLSPEALAPLLGDRGEGGYAHLASAELVPLVYQRLQAHRADLDPAVRAKCEDQSNLTMEANALLTDELQRISARCAAGGIPLMAIKGPVLARLTAGLHVRPFHDLDVVVPRHAVEDAARALHSIGYAEVRTARRHDYHRIFARPAACGAVVVELHFDLGDRERGIAPDVSGIWRRSRTIALPGYAVRAPDLTDHLLLVIMQLPHHGWSLRLLTDAGLIVSRWREEVEWDELIRRARAWAMWALTASTLYTLDAMFGVPVPEPVRSAVRPQGYFRRAQWHLAMDAVAARLAPGTDPGGARLGALLLLDRAEDIVSLVARRALGAHTRRAAQAAAAPTARQALQRGGSLRALAQVLVKSINGDPRERHPWPVGGVRNGRP